MLDKFFSTLSSLISRLNKRSNGVEQLNSSEHNHAKPSWGREDFACPHCNIHADQKWVYLRYTGECIANKELLSTHIGSLSDLCKIFESHDVPVNTPITDNDFAFIESKDKNLVWAGKEIQFEQHPATIGFCRCLKCKNLSIWRAYQDDANGDPVMIYPDSALLVPPLPEGASERVSDLYNQAASVYTRSRGATLALLRMTIETLCKELLRDEIKNKKVSLYDMILSMKIKYSLNESVIKALNFVRDTGNKAVHNNEIILEDKMNPDPLFRFVHHAVDTITRKELLEKEVEAATAKTSNKKPPAKK